MERFEIQPVLSSALPDVADFLCRWPADRDGSSGQRPNSLRVERRLEWLLLDNPVSAGVFQHGFCVRDPMGVIRGVTLCFPAAFLAGDDRFLGLCSGTFFVEPQARTLGFYLFKKYLRSPGYSFFFATTCNAYSAALWEQLGGCAVPNSEAEYIVPLRLDALLPAVVNGKTLRAAASRIAPIIARCSNAILAHLTRQSPKITIEPSRDWQKLSQLFHRHRLAGWVTADRTIEFLQWRYEQSWSHCPSETYLFHDPCGNEGWFALGKTTRGRRGQIRGSVLLDAIWPRERMTFEDIFPGILQLVDPETDALFLRPRPELDYGDCTRWIIRRRFRAPQAFAITGGGDSILTAASLDLVCADGDSGFPIAR